MSTKSVAIAVFAFLVVASNAQAVEIGHFPGFQELIQKSDAIVILRIDAHVDARQSPTLYTTHDCFIYQTLKGDIPKDSRIRLQLMDTRTAFVTPYVMGSTHLMFLTRKRSPNEATDYRTIDIEGANIRLSPFGQEKPPEGKNVEEQARNLVKTSMAYFEKEHEKERQFLADVIGKRWVGK